MHEYWHVILEALIHTAKILPFLFIVYYLIELFEYKNTKKIKNSELFKGKASPAIGALLGCVPQCGFSVVSTDLYTKQKLSIGALIAVYIATSDESIPLMISNPKSIGWMFLMLGIKIVFGILIGYITIFLYNVMFKRKKDCLKNINNNKETLETTAGHHDHNDDHEHNEEHHNHKDEQHEDHSNEDDVNDEQDLHGGCCHHHVQTKSFDWLHPMLHCLKIGLFVLVINILFGFITHIWVGEDRLIAFLNQSKMFQPVLAVLIGLIPNCASSVVITELFMLGGLSFGSLIAGLSVNAGLGLVVLIKQNKNWKENLFIVGMLIVPSLILGFVLNFI